MSDPIGRMYARQVAALAAIAGPVVPPRPRVSEHTDAARLEATRDAIRTGTAPRPRVEGEAMTEVRWKFIRHAVTYPGFVGDRDLFFYAARDAVRECDRLTAEVERLTNQKDGAYNERDHLVAALSKFFPASLERHPAEEEWDDDWRWIVFIELPTGQVSWHIHDSEVGYFAHLARETGRKWDGHLTPEKYDRLAALSLPTPAPAPCPDCDTGYNVNGWKCETCNGTRVRPTPAPEATDGR